MIELPCTLCPPPTTLTAWSDTVIDGVPLCGKHASVIAQSRLGVESDTVEAGNEATTAIDKIRNLRDVQGQNGTWNMDEYMRGLYNGLELALSILEDERAPQYKKAPGEQSETD